MKRLQESELRRLIRNELQTMKSKEHRKLINTHQKQPLKESSASRILNEAIDAEALQNALKLVEKLRKMKGKGLDQLDAAIDSAENEMSKYANKGPSLLARFGINNPLIKVATFTNALEQGFKQIPDILKLNLGDQEFLKTNIDLSIEKILEKDVNKKKTVVDTILKAFKPDGVFSNFKKIPYVSDMNLLAIELSEIPIKNIVDLVKLSATGISSSVMASDVKDAAQKTDAEKTTEKGSEAAVAQQVSASPEKAKSVIAQLDSALRGKNNVLNTNNMSKVAKALIDAGLNPDKFKV